MHSLLTGTRACRAWFGIVATVCLFGVGIELYEGAFHPVADAVFPGALAQTLNRFAYYTIVSNLLVAFVSLQIASRGWCATPLNRVLMLDALAMIFVTGLVFNTLLEHTPSFTLRYAAAVALHDIAPVMTIVGWAIFARGRNIFVSTIFLALVLPLCWLAFTLIRYAVIGWVPYPFLDAARHGWAHVALTLLMILGFQMVLGFAALAWDRAVATKRA
ncbi:MAG TPA: Pr6Pr family membrane protein [Rhizomicrobium sp.]|jgi:hypothetical protein